jgi:hypothetical protein
MRILLLLIGASLALALPARAQPPLRLASAAQIRHALVGYEIYDIPAGQGGPEQFFPDGTRGKRGDLGGYLRLPYVIGDGQVCVRELSHVACRFVLTSGGRYFIRHTRGGAAYPIALRPIGAGEPKVVRKSGWLESLTRWVTRTGDLHP